jgi:hypothetical protein
MLYNKGAPMTKTATRIIFAFAAGILSYGTAEATTPRNPQVPVTPTRLQDYMNSVPQTINVYTDQMDIPCWSSTLSNTATFTLMAELTTAFGPSHIFGLYNCSAAVPPLYVLMAGGTPGYFSTATFLAGGILTINRFDQNANFLSSTVYAGSDRNNFGFYLSSPGGTFFTQDARNPGGAAQALSYAGTGTSTGQWWLCWEDESVAAGSDRDFEDMIIFLESVSKPVPTKGVTWGDLKSRY